jgi:hypothetical protein
MSFDPAISEWGNPPKIARKSTLLICLAHGPYRPPLAAWPCAGAHHVVRRPVGLAKLCFVGRSDQQRWFLAIAITYLILNT